MAPAQSKLVRSAIADMTQMYLKHRTRISRAVYVTLFVALVNRIRHAIAEQKAASAREAAQRAERSGTTSTAAGDGDGGGGGDEAAKKKKKVELNREFFRALLRLLRIVVPGWRSNEARLLISHSFFLVVRTLISVKVAEMDGAIVKSLVKGSGKEFLMHIVWWMLIAVPATFTNSMVGWCPFYQRLYVPPANMGSAQLSYHQAELSLKYRTRLTQHIHDKYLSQLTFYGISALDDRINNPDQLIAVDVAKFSSSLAELYSNLAKPILDMVGFLPLLSCYGGADTTRLFTPIRCQRAWAERVLSSCHC